MRIVVPLTDYIPASTLTIQGDMVRRGAALPERLPADLNYAYLFNQTAGGAPVWRAWNVGLKNYLKSVPVSNIPAFDKLRLDDTGVEIITGTRDSSGNEVIAGIGYEPSVVLFFCTDFIAGNQNWSFGFDNGTDKMCIWNREDNNTTQYTNANSIRIDRGAGGRILGYISARGADGFTITFTETDICDVRFTALVLP